MTEPPLLVVDNIHTYYGESYILQGVTFSLDKGRVIGVLGRNGVGKTTLIRSLIGFTPPRAGSIVFKGMDMTRAEPYRRVAAGMSLVPQGRRIFGSLTVEENLLSSFRKRGKTATWNPDRVFKLFPRLKERRRVRASLLSGGEQQMLAIGRALVGNPDLLLLDEPTEGLGPSVIRELVQFFAHLKEEGQSILLVEQNLPFALQVTEYVYILSRGTVVYESSTPELACHPEAQLDHLGIRQSEVC